MKNVPLAALFTVERLGASVRELPMHNSAVIQALTPGIMFHGLWSGDRRWVQRLPSLGGGYIAADRVREVR